MVVVGEVASAWEEVSAAFPSVASDRTLEVARASAEVVHLGVAPSYVEVVDQTVEGPTAVPRTRAVVDPFLPSRRGVVVGEGYDCSSGEVHQAEEGWARRSTSVVEARASVAACCRRSSRSEVVEVAGCRHRTTRREGVASTGSPGVACCTGS